ncbi:hypothetical protein DAEQUDRAFT_728131 [Daedalea quercina L-15889]|uniref:AB hydrolase-1 domain-containing protein n=1 Tax=Daedalea quercina L-15889 TaxID=1314783 RepID=A0A165PKG5_9APHY|nr:hypothetical protein DAEQUDRAFT_728131 [Daedalea quercina L-15889]
MPLAFVDQHGSQLYYEDTGVPLQSSDYTTLVLIHGACFQGAVFKPLFAQAATQNMRLVAVNMRDYYGSTLYSPSELAELGSTDVDTQTKALRARGLEILTFLLWFIREENIPPLMLTTANGEFGGGGVSLLGWSWGNESTLSSIAHAGELAQDDTETLAKYMRALIIYDPSPRVFGAPASALDESYNPLNDRSLSAEELKRAFPSWVSSYYSHSTDMLDAFPSIGRDELIAGFSQEPIQKPHYLMPTLLRMSNDELSRVVNEGAVMRSHFLYEAVDGKVYTDNARNALRDTTVWPDLRVVLVWCDMSVSEALLSTWGLLKQVEGDWPAHGRRVHALRLRGANHFPHWDRPARTMQLLAEMIKSTRVPTNVEVQVREVERYGLGHAN